MAIKSLYHLDPLSTHFLCQYPTDYLIHSKYSHWVWHRHIQENMVSSLEKLNLGKETGICTALFILLLGNYKGTILDAWATCCGNKHSSSVSWESFTSLTCNTQLGTDVEDQPMAEKLWQRKLHFKKHIKELYLPPPPRKRMKDMNKQYTEKKKEMGYSRKQENNVIF